MSQDTLYFQLSNPWNTVKSPSGIFQRKAIQEGNYWHCWDYTKSGQLVLESYYADTNFNYKLFRHRYFNESKGYLSQTRLYDNGQLHDTSFIYNENGETLSYSVYNHSVLLGNWFRDSTHRNNSFNLVETEACFPGGKYAWQQYLAQHIVMPASLQKKKIKGTVLFEFKVGKDGKIMDVHVIQSLDPLLDELIIKVLQSSPLWQPAIQNQRNVISWMKQSLRFEGDAP